MIDLVAPTVAELTRSLRNGHDARVLMDETLARVDADEFGAFVHVDAARARVAANDAAARLEAGTARPLEGIPFGVKDIVDVEGMPTTAGSETFDGSLARQSATAVQRLIDAGAIPVGKTATPEWAFGDAIEGHRPRNPHDPTRWTGGSSSGSAVALAAGLVPFTVGTDTGGSIRVPSSYCGVSGIKPTTGAVPRDGVRTVSWSQDHVGPMATTADDLALVLEIMAGRAERDPASRAAPLTPARPVAGTRVGVLGGWFVERCQPAVLAALDAAVERVRDAGAEVVAVELDHADLAPIASWVISVSEFAAEHDGADVRGYTDMARERLIAGQGMHALDYLRAQRARRVVQDALDKCLARVDVLLSPATPTTAPRIAPPDHEMFEDGDRMWLEWVARNFLIANVSGIPAVVTPAAYDDDGLPAAVQVLAAPGSDFLALAIASAAGVNQSLVASTGTNTGEPLD